MTATARKALPPHPPSQRPLGEQGKRLALEQWLAASDQSHYPALSAEITNQTRLRDRLATVGLPPSITWTHLTGRPLAMASTSRLKLRAQGRLYAAVQR